MIGHQPLKYILMKLLMQIIALVSAIGICNRASAQEPSNKYVIFTFEEHYRISPHGMRKYYWIQQIDSTGSNPLHLSALFISIYSKDNLDDICMGIMTDPFLVGESTNFNLPDKHIAVRDSLQILIDKNRKRIQTIQKSWDNGQKSSIYVYVTPISGKFCAAKLRRKESNGEYYNGRIFLPFSNFHLTKEFWDTEAGKRIRASDFSRTNYSIFSNSQD